MCVSTLVSALPVGPKTLDRVSESRWPTWDSLNTTAMAGNVTELNFSGSTITRTYQGYFGNITGMIVLGDSQNNSLYDWTIASPQGEIYAVRSPTVPSWNSVTCAATWELDAEDLALNVNSTIDEDSVNNTFVVGGAPDQIARFTNAELIHPQFWVANQSIIQNTCPLAGWRNRISPYLSGPERFAACWFWALPGYSGFPDLHKHADHSCFPRHIYS